MRGNAAQKHGGGGDESAAAGHGIHKTGDEEEQTQNEKDDKGDFHGKGLVEVAGQRPVVDEMSAFVEMDFSDGE